MQLLELKLAQNDEHRLQTDINILEQQQLNNKKELDEQRHEEKTLNEKINELKQIKGNLFFSEFFYLRFFESDLEIQLEIQPCELDTLTSADIDTLRNTIETSTQR
jgi:hypothetical protein